MLINVAVAIAPELICLLYSLYIYIYKTKARQGNFVAPRLASPFPSSLLCTIAAFYFYQRRNRLIRNRLNRTPAMPSADHYTNITPHRTDPFSPLQIDANEEE